MSNIFTPSLVNAQDLGQLEQLIQQQQQQQQSNMTQQIVILPAASSNIGQAYPVLMPCTNLILPSAGTEGAAMGLCLVNGMSATSPVSHLNPGHQVQALEFNTQPVFAQQKPNLQDYSAQAMQAYAPQHQMIQPTEIVGIINAEQLMSQPQAQQQQQLISISWQTEGGEPIAVNLAQAEPASWARVVPGQQLLMASSSPSVVDINAFLANTMSSSLAAEKVNDQLQAKQWLKDSNIVNRALRALKNSPSLSSSSASSSSSTSSTSSVITEQPRAHSDQHDHRYDVHLNRRRNVNSSATVFLT